MKTKEQILGWLDKQPWANEFHRAVFMLRTDLNLFYNESFISSAFRWDETEEGGDAWSLRDTKFRQWYNSNNKPTSWEEYCKQNPVVEGEYYINKFCDILAVMPGDRDETADINVMSQKLCKAFRAYMQLIQLRNAWVKDGENGEEDEYRKIVYTAERGFYGARLGKTGLSFPTLAMAEEFIKTFKALLAIAKPLI